MAAAAGRSSLALQRSRHRRPCRRLRLKVRAGLSLGCRGGPAHFTNQLSPKSAARLHPRPLQRPGGPRCGGACSRAARDPQGLRIPTRSPLAPLSSYYLNMWQRWVPTAAGARGAPPATSFQLLLQAGQPHHEHATRPVQARAHTRRIHPTGQLNAVHFAACCRRHRDHQRALALHVNGQVARRAACHTRHLHAHAGHAAVPHSRHLEPPATSNGDAVAAAEDARAPGRLGRAGCWQHLPYQRPPLRLFCARGR
ncbi:MAG: hypothetical protein J3K34DRAFT_449786 [Monoraphidium minutum]|nr:MAG: hypothetical protein J3K34DRAFT_449786 [Monoraphidium minutum]